MINLNGKLQQNNTVSLSIENRGFRYGDSLFETIRVVDGKIIFWETHYFRLMASMRILRMDIPMSFTPENLQDEILHLVKENAQKNARVKLQVFRNSDGFYTPIQQDISYVISTYNLDHSFYVLNDNSYEIELFKDHYITSGLLSNIKSNNRLINILGSIYAQENDYQNCLLLNENKHVVEALHGNLFLINGTTIKTAPLKDGCLNGVIRGQLIKIIKAINTYTFVEDSISPFELQKADELFITNVIIGIQPITKYRKKAFTTGIAKDLLGKLNAHSKLS